MTQVLTTPATTSQPAAATRWLLACGAVSGPLYVTVAFLQVFTRDGFDLRDHPLSLLSVGDLGWIQITNFVLSGLLYLAGAVGMRRALRGTRGGTWGPALIGTFGIALIWAGVFVADPADGFPPGTPESAGAMSWHGILHGIAPVVGFLALAAACVVFARRFASRRQPGWTAYCVATAVALFVPDLFVSSPNFYVVLALAAVAGWSWASAVAARLAKDA